MLQQATHCKQIVTCNCKRCANKQHHVLHMFAVLQDDLKPGKDLIVLKVEGTDCNTHCTWRLQDLPLLDSPTHADIIKLEVGAGTNWFQSYAPQPLLHPATRAWPAPFASLCSPTLTNEVLPPTMPQAVTQLAPNPVHVLAPHLPSHSYHCSSSLTPSLTFPSLPP